MERHTLAQNEIQCDKDEIIWHQVVLYDLLAPAWQNLLEGAAYRYQHCNTEDADRIIHSERCAAKATKNDVYLVKVPVLTEYMMRRLIRVSDLSELNFGKT
jgi:hypothetical protein